MKAIFAILSFAVLIEIACGHWHKTRNAGRNSHHHILYVAPTTAPTLAPTVPPTVPPTTQDNTAAPESRVQEGLVMDYLEDKFHNDNKDNNNYHHNTPYEHNNYEHEHKHCYAFVKPDNYHLEFKDISETGTELVIGGEWEPIDLLTSFKFYDTQYTNPTVNVARNGLVYLETAEDSYVPTLQDNDETPYSVIVPFWGYWETSSSDVGLQDPAIYWQTSSSETIIQWEVNESNTGEYTQKSSGQATFQVRILSSGDIIYSYRLVTCDFPYVVCPQIGIKPSSADLDDGYKTTYYKTNCIDGEYKLFPKTNDSVLLKRVECRDLLGNTGLLKSQLYNEIHQDNNNKHNSMYDKFDIFSYLHDLVGH